MLETGTSGLMSGEGKQPAVGPGLAPFLDSTFCSARLAPPDGLGQSRKRFRGIEGDARGHGLVSAEIAQICHLALGREDREHALARSESRSVLRRSRISGSVRVQAIGTSMT